MAIDLYTYCPGGTGKKIKFCGCKDISTELEDVQRSLDAGQNIATAQQCETAMRRCGERACLLAIKAKAEVGAEEWEQARETARRLLKLQPENPVALSLSAMLHLFDDGAEQAVAYLQSAVEETGEVAYEDLLHALAVVGRNLVDEGHVYAGKAHLEVCLIYCRGENEAVEAALDELRNNRSIPLLLRDGPHFDEAAEGKPWRESYSRLVADSYVGFWRKSLQTLSELAESHPNEPVLIKAIGWMHAALAESSAAADAFNRYAAIEGVPLDEAVDAVAVANLLDPPAGERVDRMLYEVEIEDAAGAMERLLSNERVVAKKSDPREWVEEGQPAPKETFLLLDRPLPDPAELTIDNAPGVIADLAVYGKETDRSARLEILAWQTEELPAALAAASGIVGAAGEPEELEPVQLASRHSLALIWRWRLPDGTPQSQRERLRFEMSSRMLLEKWPETPHPAFGGKTPREAAAEPTNQVQVLAQILMMELAQEHAPGSLDFNRLRESLGLPRCEDIDPDGLDMAVFSLTRLHRVAPEKLSDENLIKAFVRAGSFHALRSVTRLGEELLRRESLSDAFPQEGIYSTLFWSTLDMEAAERYLQEGKRLSADRGNQGSWAVNELHLRLRKGEFDEAGRLLRRILSRYRQDEDVLRLAITVMAQHGLVTRDGKFLMPKGTAEEQPPAKEKSSLWVPEGDDDDAEREPSKLWVPGMD